MQHSPLPTERSGTTARRNHLRVRLVESSWSAAPLCWPWIARESRDTPGPNPSKAGTGAKRTRARRGAGVWLRTVAANMGGCEATVNGAVPVDRSAWRQHCGSGRESLGRASRVIAARTATGCTPADAVAGESAAPALSGLTVSCSVTGASVIWSAEPAAYGCPPSSCSTLLTVAWLLEAERCDRSAEWLAKSAITASPRRTFGRKL